MQNDKIDKLTAWAIILLGTALVGWIFLGIMLTKNQMCIDIGNKVYGHPMSWLQCLAF